MIILLALLPPFENFILTRKKNIHHLHKIRITFSMHFLFLTLVFSNQIMPHKLLQIIFNLTQDYFYLIVWNRRKQSLILLNLTLKQNYFRLTFSQKLSQTMYNKKFQFLQPNSNNNHPPSQNKHKITKEVL